ncbi:hypothetical protein QBC46DRAFT_352351 [Diplogelasinospora grovesii]|uniref:DUF4045 domain-containing protein n=1 Tax=Diplogelasinospora grovesii TaxID=303347 RepID=A0AAN6NAW0_9PEZI|nr:hypothetical protein QBC46DRAFT_352351 [Diplogelasinospora grovesii]
MSNDVSDFLRSVEALKGRREEEDEARSRELEEKILQEKKERQARRAERARSISPQKSSPAHTPSSSSHRISFSPGPPDGTSLPSPFALESTGSPRPRPVDFSEAVDSGADYSNGSPTKEIDSPFDSDVKRSSLPSLTSPSAAVPPSARSPLSWQRRPTSQGSTGRPVSRPLSMVAAENAAARTSSPNAAELPVSASANEQTQTPTRDQIAQSLAGKDPSWFRQTADRGQNSAAFRKNQVEDQDIPDMSTVRAQLPGMSRSPPAEPESAKDAPRDTPSSPPSVFAGKLGSPLPLTPAQRFDPPALAVETTREAAGDAEPSVTDRQSMVSPTGRTSPTRPLSPTKGMGGFVQSAMMKRSDSVKRWSVTSPAGLQRGDSAAANSRARSKSRPPSMFRDGSTTPSSRPTSSHEKQDDQTTPTPAGGPSSAETKDEANDKITPPTSPSKTMDPRRWSPTKSSWLETALNKPESPKPKPAPPPNQPAWMVELNKAKAHKANPSSGFESGPSSSLPKKPEIRTGGLMRAPPMGTNVKPTPLRGFGGVPPVDRPVPPPSVLRSNLKTSPRIGSEDPESESQGSSEDTGAKTKPEAPLKKDFRANLKPRAPPPETGAAEPVDELKNVFGSLRRAKTQNYVAPDELKNNILRGKAGLNATGGPKPSERKDEFKEAILKKKEEFKKAQQEGRAVTRAPSSSSEKTLPEALAKKLEMSQLDTSRRGSATSDVPYSPSLGTPTQPNSTRSSFVSTFSSKRDSSDVTSPVTRGATFRTEREPAANPVTPTLPTLHKEVSAPGRLQAGKPPSIGGLAERFNPALAGLLARGPPAMASGPSTSPGASGGTGSGAAETEAPAGPGPQLSHMTKNRARGPKRRAPNSVAQPAAEPKPAAVEEPPVVSPKPVSPKSERWKPPTAPKPEVIPLVDSKPTVQEKPQSAFGSVISLVDSSAKKAEEETRSTGQPIALVDSPAPIKTRPRSPTKVHEQVAALAAKAQQAKSPEPKDEPVAQPSSPKKLDMKRMSKFFDEQPSSPAASKPEPEKAVRSPSPIKMRPLSDLAPPPTPPPKDRANDKVDSEPVVSVRSGAALFGGAMVGLGLTQAATTKPPRAATVEDDDDQPPTPPAKNSPERTRSPLKGSRPLPPPPTASAKVSSSYSSPVRSPTKFGLEVSAMLTEFFGPERPRRNYTADAAEILMQRKPAVTTNSRIRTQYAQLFQVSGDGKKMPVPAHYERVLFEREMYFCLHTFTNESGRKVNEVYFWAGDEVPQPIVDDAHVFVQREARSFGGKLIRLVQGKETPEFLQALGGIVIVRRGSSNKYDSLASNMLCGRRYLGQGIAFDEVDFSPASLCTGFPYLITQQGKCYLWKGKGSDVDELGCARLVGMDLALMGELVEVEEGNEPEVFWKLFDGVAQPQKLLRSADHWKLKPNYDRYGGRLFKADTAERQQIVEISPFKQSDLVPSNIYILDAFFEIYIIVGSKSQHQYAAFRNALDFAQEYGILAAGMEDRPFVPVSTVVLEGVPKDLKAVFRKWRDEQSPTIMNAHRPDSVGSIGSVGSINGEGGGETANKGVNTGGRLKRARSLRIVPLTQALQALTE